MRLSEALDLYLMTKPLGERTKRDYKAFLNRCVPDFLELEIEEITKQQCLERYQQLKAACSARASSNGRGQANYVFRILRAVLNFAYAYCDIQKANPVGAFTALGAWAPLEKRTTYIQLDELAIFYESLFLLSALDRNYYLLLLLTGLRASEAASLEWSEVDFQRRQLTVLGSKAKSGRCHKIPISKELLTVLLELKELSTGRFVFGFEPYSQHKRLYESLELLNGFSCNPHALRRTFATLAKNKAGVDFQTIKRCLNHAQVDITERYIQSDPEALRPAFELINTVIMSACRKEKPRIRLSLEQIKHA